MIGWWLGMSQVVRVMVTGSREWGNRALWTKRLSDPSFGLEAVEVRSAVETLCAEHDARMEGALAWAWKHASRQYAGASLVLMHGNADGADKNAARMWASRGLPVEPVPALWDKEGKGAGFKRNLRMVESAPVVVLAFQFDRSPGTEHAATAAARRGIPVWLWAQRGFEDLSSIRVHAGNVKAVFPPFGESAAARFQQAAPDASPSPEAEEGGRRPRDVRLPSLRLQSSLPLPAVGCARSRLLWVTTSPARCGTLGGRSRLCSTTGPLVRTGVGRAAVLPRLTLLSRATCRCVPLSARPASRREAWVGVGPSGSAPTLTWPFVVVGLGRKDTPR